VVKLKLKSHGKDGVTVLELSGKLMGGADSEIFKNAIKESISNGVNNILVDLSHVDWINSTGLGILMAGYTTVQKAQGKFKIAGSTDRIKSLFMITKLLTIFEDYNTVDEGLKSFQEG
jgi:anti-sigma B factor antagonist